MGSMVTARYNSCFHVSKPNVRDNYAHQSLERLSRKWAKISDSTTELLPKNPKESKYTLFVVNWQKWTDPTGLVQRVTLPTAMSMILPLALRLSSAIKTMNFL